MCFIISVLQIFCFKSTQLYLREITVNINLLLILSMWLTERLSPSPADGPPWDMILEKICTVE